MSTPARGFAAKTAKSAERIVIEVDKLTADGVGKYLDGTKLNGLLPKKFGPDAARRVLRMAVQKLVDGAIDQNQVGL
jgi:hypothetical protein